MDTNLKNLLFANHAIKDSPAADSPWAMVSAILPNVFLLSGIILLLLIVGAGVAIIASGDNPQQTQQAKQVATFAILGFAIIFTSYWLIQIISTITGIPILGGPPTT